MDKKTSLARPSLRQNRLTRTPQARPELTRVTIDAGATQNLTSSDRDWVKLTLESTSRTSLAQPSLRRNRLTRTPKARPELTRVAIDAGATQDLTSSDSDWFKLTLESTSRTSLARPSLRHTG